MSDTNTHTEGFKSTETKPGTATKIVKQLPRQREGSERERERSGNITRGSRTSSI